MAVDGHLVALQGDILRSADLSYHVDRGSGALPLMHRRSALEIREGESTLSVAAISGAQQRKQRGILRDGHYLAVAERPASRREIKAYHPDFTNKVR